MIVKIISGGQSGVDRAALDAAIKLDIPQYKKDLVARMTASKARTKMVVDSFGYDM